MEDEKSRTNATGGYYPLDAVRDLVRDAAEKRLSGEFTIETTEWSTGGYQVRAFHTLDSVYQANDDDEETTVFHRERIRFAEESGYLKHEVVRKRSGRTREETLWSRGFAFVGPRDPRTREADRQDRPLLTRVAECIETFRTLSEANERHAFEGEGDDVNVGAANAYRDAANHLERELLPDPPGEVDEEEGAGILEGLELSHVSLVPAEDVEGYGGGTLHVPDDGLNEVLPGLDEWDDHSEEELEAVRERFAEEHGE